MKYLRNGPCLACINRVMDAHGKLGEHKRSVWVAWGEASASLASRVLSQLPKCIHNSIDAQLKHGPFLLEHCHFKRKLIKYRILLNHSERFDWLNAIMWFDRCMGVHLSRFRCMLSPYKKRTKNCQLCSICFHNLLPGMQQKCSPWLPPIWQPSPLICTPSPGPRTFLLPMDSWLV